MTIAWEAAAPDGTQVLHWGPNDEQVAGTLVSDKLYEARVTGLTASSSYDYYVVYGATTSPIGNFITAPSGNEPFRFGVTGDNRSDSSGHASVVAATLPFAPDFMLNTGDIVDNSNYTEFFNVETELLRNAAIFPAPGNHDAASMYQYGFDRPNYYAFRWGNALFLSLSTNDSTSSGSAQYQFVQTQLQAAQNDMSITWIFVYHHYPVWSSGYHGSDSSVTALNGLYKQYGVDVVFTGHDHDYERVERDGVVYLVSGGGGVGLRSMGSPVSGQQFAESARHVVIADVDGNSLDLKAYRTDGSLMDSKHLQK